MNGRTRNIGFFALLRILAVHTHSICNDLNSDNAVQVAHSILCVALLGDWQQRGRPLELAEFKTFAMSEGSQPAKYGSKLLEKRVLVLGGDIWHRVLRGGGGARIWSDGHCVGIQPI